MRGSSTVAPLEMPNGRLVSRALDNRVGCYVAAEAARLVVCRRRRGRVT